MSLKACILSIFLLFLTLALPIQAIIKSDIEKYRPNEASTGWQGLLPIINNFLNDIRSGDIDKAYNTYTTKALQKKTSLKEFKDLVTSTEVLKDNKLFRFLSFYFDNGIAIFQGSLISSHGENLMTEFDLKTDGSSWKIDGLHLFKPEMISPPEEEYQGQSNSMLLPKEQIWSLPLFFSTGSLSNEVAENPPNETKSLQVQPQ